MDLPRLFIVRFSFRRRVISFRRKVRRDSSSLSSRAVMINESRLEGEIAMIPHSVKSHFRFFVVKRMFIL